MKACGMWHVAGHKIFWPFEAGTQRNFLVHQILEQITATRNLRQGVGRIASNCDEEFSMRNLALEAMCFISCRHSLPLAELSETCSSKRCHADDVGVCHLSFVCLQ